MIMYKVPSSLILCAFGLFALVAPVAGAETLTEIPNYRAYSPTLSSSGQPSAEQLEAVKEAGFERVIFLAYADSNGSLPNEDHIVERLGMQFAQVPVDWEAPQASDFYTFAAIIKQAPESRTLVHCQVNFRASTFSFLYRVLYDGVPVDQAKDDLNSVWVPNETWRALIFRILAENGVSADCDACLWEGTESE